jgi:hypothetical protein
MDDERFEEHVVLTIAVEVSPPGEPSRREGEHPPLIDEVFARPAG